MDNIRVREEVFIYQESRIRACSAYCH